MAGLAAAVRARELGVDVRVVEKGTRPGGSMLLSSCVVWRHREWEDFRAECPEGDERLQRLVWERLDDAIAWLESLGAPVVEHETGNPLTVGKRFDPRGLTELLAEKAGDVSLADAGRSELHRSDVGVHLHRRPTEVTILCTGGFQGGRQLVARHIAPAAPLRLRANPWSAGDGLRAGLAEGAALSPGMSEFYGRNMADVDFADQDFVPLAQLYGRWARVYDEEGREFFDGEVSWSENDLVQATARRPGARAWYVLDDAALDQRVRGRPVSDFVAKAPTAVSPEELPFATPAGSRVAVRVAAAITHTIGGLRVDDRARVVREDGSPIDGLLAAGADAGGIAAGGYASGLAAALVLGRVAAETAAGAAA